MVTYEDVVNNIEVREFIKNAQIQLDVLGYTEHSYRHCSIVAERAEYILRTLVVMIGSINHLNGIGIKI